MGRKFLVLKPRDNITRRQMRVARDKKFNGIRYFLVKSIRADYQFLNDAKELQEARRIYPDGVITEHKGGWIFYYATGKSIYQVKNK